MSCRVGGCDSTAVVRPEEHRVGDPGGADHRLQFGHEVGDGRHGGRVDGVRVPHAPLVVGDEPGEAGEPAKASRVGVLLPLDGGGEGPPDVHEVRRARPGHLEREVCVTAPGEVDARRLEHGWLPPGALACGVHACSVASGVACRKGFRRGRALSKIPWHFTCPLHYGPVYAGSTSNDERPLGQSTHIQLSPATVDQHVQGDDEGVGVLTDGVTSGGSGPRRPTPDPAVDDAIRGLGTRTPSAVEVDWVGARTRRKSASPRRRILGATGPHSVSVSRRRDVHLISGGALGATPRSRCQRVERRSAKNSTRRTGVAVTLKAVLDGGTEGELR